MVMADWDIYARAVLLRVADRRYWANLPSRSSRCSALRAEGFRVYGSQWDIMGVIGS